MADTSPIIVALDYPEAAPALAVADLLDPTLARVKVGKQLFTREGPAVVHALHDRGFDVFLDLKFHDIPNTIAGAVKAAAELGVWMVNVHATGGSRMMAAAQAALQSFEAPPLLIGVTVLTSMDERDLSEIGWQEPVEDRVLAMAELCKASGLAGVVCSAQEASLLRDQVGSEFLKVTPGIRLPGDSADDQRRVVTPWAAMADGATHLVMGRSITGAPSPGQALAQTVAELRHHAGAV